MSIKKEAAARTYRLMFLCDACSLVLCKDEVPVGGRKLELGTDPDGASCFIFAKSEKAFSVDPWPFEADKFEVDIEVFHLKQLQFKSDHALYEALDKAEIKIRTWVFEQ